MMMVETNLVGTKKNKMCMVDGRRPCLMTKKKGALYLGMLNEIIYHPRSSPAKNASASSDAAAAPYRTHV